ncbi:hypothetical protein SAMN04244574_01858 [Azotobacter beijerinckii]|uniref:Uncharacterized protein n=1 Tax=Azotobacter beijerinckii TaxID=170623 RepID=A0A1I4CDF4_9GAMM|nr:hypothetical protein SAMN04244571_04810 [Azotobacter beijerinckii]SFK78813.1 hypothetical protein SAMN04244574_01858 [Azotobacter beijerinckii]
MIIGRSNVQVKGRPRYADVPVSEAHDLNRMLGLGQFFIYLNDMFWTKLDLLSSAKLSSAVWVIV